MAADDIAEIIIFQSLMENQVHIIDGGVMVFILKTMGIHKMCIYSPYLCRLFIHHSHKVLHAAAYIFRDGHGGVITGIDHESQKQFP